MQWCSDLVNCLKKKNVRDGFHSGQVRVCAMDSHNLRPKRNLTLADWHVAGKCNGRHPWGARHIPSPQ